MELLICLSVDSEIVCVCVEQDSELPPEPKDVPVLIQLRLLDQRDATAKVRVPDQSFSVILLLFIYYYTIYYYFDLAFFIHFSF